MSDHDVYINRLEIEARRAPALAALRARIQGNRGTGERLSRGTVERASPPFGKQPVSGTKARGLAYEKKVGRVLEKLCKESNWKLWDHQWFIYRHGKDTKYFQPDFIIERSEDISVLIEAKLTYVDTSIQLDKYLKYMEIFGLPCFPVTIVRNLVRESPEVVDDFSKIKPNSVLHLWV